MSFQSVLQPGAAYACRHTENWMEKAEYKRKYKPEADCHSRRLCQSPKNHWAYSTDCLSGIFSTATRRMVLRRIREDDRTRQVAVRGDR